MSAAALVYVPRPVRVTADEAGRPLSVAGVAVTSLLEEWLVEDRWWSERPIARHYFEVVLADGSCRVVFREAAHWFGQRA